MFEPSVEALLQYHQFYLKHHIRRLSDVTKWRSFRKIDKLPKNAVFHFVDNLSTDSEFTDTPRLGLYPFFKSEYPKKYLFSLYRKNDVSLRHVDFPYRWVSTRLSQNLTTFNLNNKKRFIGVSRIDRLPKSGDQIGMINYNPLFRVVPTIWKPVVANQMVRFCIENIFLTIDKHTSIKENYIFIPLQNDLMFNAIRLFAMAERDQLSNSLLQTNHFSFHVLIGLLGFILDNPSTGFIPPIDQSLYKSIHLAFFNKDRIAIISLSDIKKLLVSRAYIIKFVNSIMAMTHKDHSRIQQVLDKATEDKLEDIKTGTGDIDNSNIEILEIDDNNWEERTSDSGKKAKAIVGRSSIAGNVPVPMPTEILNKTEEAIKSEDLTTKMKDRVMRKADEMLSVPVVSNGKKTASIGDILSAEVDYTVESEYFDAVKDKVPDKTMAKSSVHVFDKKYREQLMRKDILSSLVSFADRGLVLTSFEETDEVNSFTRIRHYRVSFEDYRGKSHTIKFKLPIPDDDGYFLINGVKTSMKKQFVNLPICKISPTRVSLSSNYNKAMVNKIGTSSYHLPSYIIKMVRKLDLDINLIMDSHHFEGVDVPYEYALVGSKIVEISSKEGFLYFDYHTRFKRCKVDEEKIAPLEEKFGILAGKSNSGSYYFYSMDNRIHKVTLLGSQMRKQSESSILEFIFEDTEVSAPYEWCNITLLDKDLPIVFLLSYKFGFENVLKMLDVKYRIVERGKRILMSSNEIRIPFKDVSLIIDRYPLKKSLIVSGWRYFQHTKNILMADLESEDIYYTLLDTKGLSTNYLIGIDNFFSFFVDPITADILRQMNEPTDPHKLLIRAVEMLVEDRVEPHSSLKNFRIRGLERFGGMVYNDIARQYANYKSYKLTTGQFSINTESIYQRIVQDQTMDLQEEINPIQSIKETAKATYSGFGGRTAESFIERDRKFPEDGVGILSEATPDSQNVAMVVQLTADPKIKNLRGFFDISDIDSLTPANIMSDTALLMPGVSNDDPKRANFVSVQLTHYVPVPSSTPQRIRTGAEQVIPYKTSTLFSVIAEDAGKVLSVDTKVGTIVVEYKDGVKKAYRFGDIEGDVSGTTILHHVVLNDGIKPGKKLKKGDLIAYHKDFFYKSTITDSLSLSRGTEVKVMINETKYTREDSSAISRALADKMKFTSVYKRIIVSDITMEVVSFKNLGESVVYDDVLVQLEPANIATLQSTEHNLFDELRYNKFKSRHHGFISDIQVFCTDTELLTDSMKKFIATINRQKKRRANSVKGTINGDQFKVVNTVEPGTRVKGIDIGDEDVLILYNIASEVECGVGDKLVLDSSLKTVIASVYDEPIEMEDGTPIDIEFGGESIFNRIILSPLREGYLDRLLEQVERDIVDEYFK